jgi:hypothetical protein
VNKLISVCVAAAVVACLFAGTPVTAQSRTDALETHMKQVRAKVVQKRNSALNTILQLDDEQAKAFWPLQKAYDKELQRLGKLDRELVRQFGKIYDKLDATTSADIAARFFDLERDRLDLQQKYLKKVSEQVSPVIAVQFIQLQRQFEIELTMERMKYSPLAE